MTIELNSTETTKGIIQSLDRGLELLELISKSQEASGLPELAEALGVERSTVHRLLATLLQRGYVNQDSVTKHYTIGYKVVELSRRAIDGYSLRISGKSAIKNLVKETGESANLAVLAGKDVVCIDHESSPSPLAVTNDIGSIFVLQSTSLGKAILAFLPDEIRNSLISGIKYQAFTPRTIINQQMLENNILLIRQQYYALDDEERHIGVRCLAAPIFDYRNKVIGAIGITAPTVRLPLEKVDAVSRLVKKAAFEVSVQMGYPPTTLYP